MGCDFLLEIAKCGKDPRYVESKRIGGYGTKTI